SPTASGLVPGALTVSTDAPLGTDPVGLSGTGSGSIVSNVSLSPASLTFGNVVAGGASATQVVTLTNTSASTSLTINSVTVSGTSYAETDSCVGQVIAPGSTCTISVTFQPYANLAPLSYPGAITVSDSDGLSPQVLGLSGTAVAPISSSED